MYKMNKILENVIACVRGSTRFGLRLKAKRIQVEGENDEEVETPKCLVDTKCT
jgi:hypothetical protein